MCGICGVFGSVDKDILKSMCTTLTKRGPDDEGYYQDDHVGLAMRRLSIIDLQKGKQPVHNEDESVWVVFNGEIYNYKELKKKLTKHRFYTDSDTEVIVHLYEEFGEKFVDHLNGMFSIALWDSKKKKLLLVRDRLGIKPLYYYQKDKTVVFGSEIKAILKNPQVKREVNTEALQYFMGHEYVPSPLSIFKGIHKLEAGHMLIVGETVEKRKYWDIKNQPKHSREEFFSETLKENLKESVKKRMIADVPLGAFLSGGVDSSFIVALMSEVSDSPVKTFSIGFEDASYNELRFAKQIAEQYSTDHHEEILKPSMLDIIQKITKYYDEPNGDTASIPTFLVSQMTRKKVKVALSGDGGDELFAGYERYMASKLDRAYQKFPMFVRKPFQKTIEKISPSSRKKGPINMAKRFVKGAEFEGEHHVRWQYFLEKDEEKQILQHPKDLDMFLYTKKYYNQLKADRLTKELFADVKTYLSDAMLVKIDRMSMANSLEVRVPFLDHNFVEFAFSIPSNLKLKGFTKKYILKKAAAKYLPKEITHRKKHGFSSPVKNWLREELKDFAHDTLFGSEGMKYFNKKYTEKLLNDHLSKKHDNSHKLWSMMNFSLWHKEYIE